MENMWVDFDDYDLAVLCIDYGVAEQCQFEKMLPVTLANRSYIEQLLTEIELENAFGE